PSDHLVRSGDRTAQGAQHHVGHGEQHHRDQCDAGDERQRAVDEGVECGEGSHRRGADDGRRHCRENWSRISRSRFRYCSAGSPFAFISSAHCATIGSSLASQRLRSSSATGTICSPWFFFDQSSARATFSSSWYWPVQIAISGPSSSMTFFTSSG